MKKILTLSCLLLLLAHPAGALAAGREIVIGNMRSWPSRRSLRAAVRKSTTVHPDRITIREIPLDRTFASSDLGVKIQCPSSWEIQDAPHAENQLTLIVMFLSPMQGAHRDVRQNVNLVVEQLPEEMTLAQYTDLGIAVEREFFQDYRLLSSADVLVAGVYRAHRVVFTSSVNGNDMTFEQIWMVRGKTAHVWTFADAAGVFDEHVETFRRMMDTLIVQ